MKPIDPSKYRRPICLQKPVDTTDTGGGKVRIWQDVFSGQPVGGSYQGTVLMASVKPLGGRELLHAERLEGRGLYQIAIRYNPDLIYTPQMRVYDDGRYYNIRSISDVEELHQEWSILAEETTQPE